MTPTESETKPEAKPECDHSIGVRWGDCDRQGRQILASDYMEEEQFPDATFRHCPKCGERLHKF